MEEIKNINITFVKLGALGDIAFALPAPSYAQKILSKMNAKGIWSWVIGQKYAPLLKGHRDISRLFTVDDQNFYSRSKFQQMKAVFSLLKNLFLNLPKQDLIIIAHRNLSYGLLFKIAFPSAKVFQLSRSDITSSNHHQSKYSPTTRKKDAGGSKSNTAPNVWTHWINIRSLNIVSVIRNLFLKFWNLKKIVNLKSLLKPLIYFVEIRPFSCHESVAIRTLVHQSLSSVADNSSDPMTTDPWEISGDYLLDSANELDKANEIDTANEQNKFDFFFKFKDQINKPLILLHIGGGQNIRTDFVEKQWPYFEELIQKILCTTSWNIVLVGAKGGDEKAAQKILSTIPEYQLLRIQSLCGQLQFRGLAQFFIRTQKKFKNKLIFLGADSGPLHLADGLGIPCVGLYGPTSPISWGVLGKKSIALGLNPDCSPCYKDDGVFSFCSEKNKHHCMNELTNDFVFERLCNAMTF